MRLVDFASLYSEDTISCEIWIKNKRIKFLNEKKFSQSIFKYMPYSISSMLKIKDSFIFFLNENNPLKPGELDYDPIIHVSEFISTLANNEILINNKMLNNDDIINEIEILNDDIFYIT